MKSFRFPLERVLGWRRTQLRVEEKRMRQMNAEMARLDATLAALDADRCTAQRAIEKQGFATGCELASLAEYLNGWQRTRAIALKRRAEQESRIQEQSKRLLAARRRARLLEHLRERRLAEWTRELNRETENFAAESFLSRLIRQASPARRGADSGG